MHFFLQVYQFLDSTNKLLQSLNTIWGTSEATDFVTETHRLIFSLWSHYMGYWSAVHILKWEKKAQPTWMTDCTHIKTLDGFSAPIGYRWRCLRCTQHSAGSKPMNIVSILPFHSNSQSPPCLWTCTQAVTLLPAWSPPFQIYPMGFKKKKEKQRIPIHPS